jgi:chromosome segregation ATPase
MNLSPSEVMRRLEKATSSARLLRTEKEQLTLNVTALQEALEELKQKLAKTRQKLAAVERDKQQLEQGRKALVEKEQLLTETVRSITSEKQGYDATRVDQHK